MPKVPVGVDGLKPKSSKKIYHPSIISSLNEYVHPCHQEDIDQDAFQTYCVLRISDFVRNGIIFALTTHLGTILSFQQQFLCPVLLVSSFAYF